MKIASKARFDICHPITAKWEGGWADHPDDPGGKTMYGVTEAVFHNWLRSQGKPIRPVRSITRAEALAIYFKLYWQPTAERYNLVPGVDLAVYDAGVNSGVSRGIQWLKAGASAANDHAQTVKNICKRRLSFMQGLRIWATFGRGWANRVADIEARGVAMAVEFMGASVEKRVVDEADAAQDLSDKQRKGGVAVGAGTGGGTAVEAIEPGTLSQGLPWWVLVILIGAALGIAGFLAWRSHLNRIRMEAYDEVMGDVIIEKHLGDILSNDETGA